MFTLKVEAAFSAAHRLPEYNGKCRRIHGHRWVIQSTYEVVHLDTQGMAIDLTILQTTLQHTISMYDHQSLNSIMTNNPTAENLARAIFNRLRGLDSGRFLTQVAVEESPSTVVIYREDEKVKKADDIHRGG